MLIQWTPTGGGIAQTLGNDAVKFAVVIEQLGGASIDQIEPLCGSAKVAQFPRGNVSGEVVFRSTKTYASNEATYAAFKTEYARLNQQGLLVLTEGATVLNYANAILRNLQRPFDGTNGGARMSLRYTFAVSTIT